MGFAKIFAYQAIVLVTLVDILCIDLTGVLRLLCEFRMLLGLEFPRTGLLVAIDSDNDTLAGRLRMTAERFVELESESGLVSTHSLNPGNTPFVLDELFEVLETTWDESGETIRMGELVECRIVLGLSR